MRLITHDPRSGRGLEIREGTRVVLRASDYGWLGLTGEGRGSDYGYAECARLASTMARAFGVDCAYVHVGPPCYQQSGAHPASIGWRAVGGTAATGFGFEVPVAELRHFDEFCRQAFTYEPVTVIIPRAVESRPAALRVPWLDTKALVDTRENWHMLVWVDSDSHALLAFVTDCPAAHEGIRSLTADAIVGPPNDEG